MNRGYAKYRWNSIKRIMACLADIIDADIYGDTMFVEERVDEIRSILQDEVVEE